jgi:alpha-maltose-1-phosphate synthase
MKVAMPLRSLLHYSTELANGLASAGASVLAMYPDGSTDWGLEPGETIREAVNEVLRPEVKPVVIEYPPTTNLRHSVSNLKVIYQLSKGMVRYKPDVIHLQSNRDYRIYLATRIMARRCPFVYTVHDANPHLGESWDRMWRIVHKRYLKQAARVICASEWVKQLMMSQGIEEERIDLVTHSIRALFRTWSKPEYKEEEKTVLFFGRMHKYKGVGVLLDAIPLVREKVPDARFILAGAGPELEARAEYIASLQGVELICNRIPNREVSRLFARASVVTLPYLEASQSGVTMIAYAFDKPVVVSNVGGLPEVVEDGMTGLVVPPGDAEKLARALVRILSDTKYRSMLKRNVHDLAEGPLSSRSFGERVLACHQKAIEHHRRLRSTG